MIEDVLLLSYRETDDNLFEKAQNIIQRQINRLTILTHSLFLIIVASKVKWCVLWINTFFYIFRLWKRNFYKFKRVFPQNKNKTINFLINYS